jgi:hypothetical protein
VDSSVLIPGLPANLPSVAHAKIPATYQAAKTAIAECVRVDECQDWADKAEALASYARQADDDSLRRMANRIQARGIRRCGELIREIAPKEMGGPRAIGNGTVTNSMKQWRRMRPVSASEAHCPSRGE